MGKTVTTRYDVAEHLRTPEEWAAYLEACLEEANGNAAFIAKALGDIARAKGMTQVARDAGRSRESLEGPLRRTDAGFRHHPQARRRARPQTARRGRSGLTAEAI